MENVHAGAPMSADFLAFPALSVCRLLPLRADLPAGYTRTLEIHVERPRIYTPRYLERKPLSALSLATILTRNRLCWVQLFHLTQSSRIFSAVVQRQLLFTRQMRIDEIQTMYELTVVYDKLLSINVLQKQYHRNRNCVESAREYYVQFASQLWLQAR